MRSHEHELFSCRPERWGAQRAKVSRPRRAKKRGRRDGLVRLLHTVLGVLPGLRPIASGRETSKESIGATLLFF